MNRRTFLKGAAATAAIGGIGMRRPTKSAAQASAQYELIDVYTSDQSVLDAGTNWHGTLKGIANDGTMVGDSVVGGLLTPTVWSADGSPTYLSLGTFAGVNGAAGLVNSSGRVVAFMWSAGSVAGTGSYAVFDNGILNEALSSQAIDDRQVVINSLTEQQLMTGSYQDMPARWVDDVLETAALPDGFEMGAGRATEGSGSIAGTLWPAKDFINNPTIPAPFIWGSDGTFQVLDSPAGYLPSGGGRLQVFELDENGDIVVAVRQGDLAPDYAVRYSNGAQLPIQGLTGEGVRVMSTNSSGALLGQSMRDGFWIPTIWTGDQPVVIADLIVPGPDRLLTDVYDINDSGAIVGQAQDSAGVPYGVLLRPV